MTQRKTWRIQFARAVTSASKWNLIEIVVG